MDNPDQHLLERYCRSGDQAAFGEVLRRHLNLVYSAALRQVRSPLLAEEVAQSVFTHLARRARFLAPDIILPAWLWQVARRMAINVARREARHRHREHLAYELAAMNTADADWTGIEPLLDEALAALPTTDRTVVLLRWFEGKSLREIASLLCLSEDAAQKRGSRALDRLRSYFARRGITTSSGALAAALTANAVQAAPAGLAATLAESSLASSAVAEIGGLAAFLSAFFAMTNTLKVALAGVVLAAGVVIVINSRTAPALPMVRTEPAPTPAAAVAVMAESDPSIGMADAPAPQVAGNASAGQAADTTGKMSYSVQSPIDSEGWSSLTFQLASDVVPDGAGGEVIVANGLGLEFDYEHPISKTVTEDGSTLEVYGRPDGSTLVETTLANGTVIRVVKDKSKGATAAPAGNLTTSPVAPVP